MMRACVVLFLGVLLTSGCAFKGKSDTEGAEGAESSPQISPRDGSLASLSLAWDAQEHPLEIAPTEFVQRTPGVWVREAPISLPVQVPETVHVVWVLHQDAQAFEGAEVQVAAVTGEGVATRQVGVGHLEIAATQGGVSLGAIIQGLPLVLSKDREQRLFITLRITKTGLPLTEIRLLLVTPPSAWTEEGRDANPTLLPAILQTQALEIHLVERVRYHNDSWAAVRLSFPFRIASQAAANLTHYEPVLSPDAVPHGERHVQDAKSEERTEAVDLYVVPSIPDVTRRWPGLADEGARTVSVPSGGSIEIGLYAPSSLQGFLAPLRSLTPNKVMASVGANAHCHAWVPPNIPASVNGDEGRSYCLMLRDSAHYAFSDEAIDACTNSIKWMRQCVASGWAAEPCNQAALSDDRVDQLRAPHPDNGVPWPSFMGCKRFGVTSDNRTSYIYEGWSWEAVNAEFLQGLQWQSAQVAANNIDSIDGVLRFDVGMPAANGEGRTLKLFSKSKDISSF